MTPQECLETVIRPTMIVMGLDRLADEEVMLGIAIQESGLRTRHQIQGPALGLWQMEPKTHDDCWTNYLDYRHSLTDKILSLCDGAAPSSALMVSNDRYACAMARVKLLRAPAQLPVAGDIAGYAAFWKHWYNTPAGKGTEAEFIVNWHAAMGTSPAAPTI